MRNLTDRLLGLAVAGVVCALALRWSIEYLRPVLGIATALVLGGVALRYLIQRRSHF